MKVANEGRETPGQGGVELALGGTSRRGLELGEPVFLIRNHFGAQLLGIFPRAGKCGFQIGQSLQKGLFFGGHFPLSALWRAELYFN